MKVILSQDSLKKLAELNKAKKESEAVSEDANDTEKEPELEIAIKYNVKNVPFVVVCDSYGNNLDMIIPKINSFADALKIMKELTAKQKELGATITNNYEKTVKQFKSELEKK
ncbi:MAG: hypothetical protein V1709_05550, partial [Planctomycetota bacterium]